MPTAHLSDWAIAILAIWFWIMYECGGCGKLFKTTWWLSWHQKTCKPHKTFLEAGSQKFQKAHSTPKTSGNLLSKFNSLIFGHGRSGSSHEQLVGVSDLKCLYIETLLTDLSTELKWHLTWARQWRTPCGIGSRCHHDRFDTTWGEFAHSPLSLCPMPLTSYRQQRWISFPTYTPLLLKKVN